MPAHRHLSLVVAALLLVLSLPPVPAGAAEGPGSAGLAPKTSRARHVAALTPVRSDALTRARAARALTDSRYALERAISLFHPGSLAARYKAFGAVLPNPRAATTILRDLAVRLNELSGPDLRRARALLARPTDGTGDFPLLDGYTPSELLTETDSCAVDPSYDAHFCIHWVTTGVDRVSGAGTVPAYVDVVKGVLDTVWDTETGSGASQFGFRTPKDDWSTPNVAGGNPDGKVDIFLKDLLSKGLYGYCTSDDPNIADPSYAYYDMSAYCVLDNDYVGYGYADTTIPLKVTAAHEFFHDVQFAYDAFEDTWFLEGTATWMEDQVYDDLSGNDRDDSYQYLSTSPLSSPQTPLDRGVPGSLWVYGTWIFWRFLSEYFGSGGIQSQAVVKEIWERADGSGTGNAGQPGPDDYSTQALSNVLIARGTTFRDAFAKFGQWLAIPSRKFSEGALYPKPAIMLTFVMKGVRSSVLHSVRLNHMSERLWVFKPGAGVRATSALRIRINGLRGAQTEASALTVLRSGKVRYLRVPIDQRGDGAAQLRFGRGTVSRVILVLGNAGIRFDCWAGANVSCSGVSLDNNRLLSVSASQA